MDFKKLPDNEVATISCCSGCRDRSAVVFSLVEPRVHDNKEGIALVEDIVQASKGRGRRIKRVLGDKVWDRMFDRLREMGIVHGIIPRKGSKVRKDGSARDDAVRDFEEHNRELFAVLRAGVESM